MYPHASETYPYPPNSPSSKHTLSLPSPTQSSPSTQHQSPASISSKQFKILHSDGCTKSGIPRWSPIKNYIKEPKFNQLTSSSTNGPRPSGTKFELVRLETSKPMSGSQTSSLEITTNTSHQASKFPTRGETLLPSSPLRTQELVGHNDTTAIKSKTPPK